MGLTISSQGHLKMKMEVHSNEYYYWYYIGLGMNAIEGNILIPDQGAWNGFKQIAKFLGKDLIQVKTNQGLITSELLTEAIDQAIEDGRIDSIGEDNKSALFLTSFAAYAAEQDIKEISKVLHDNNILLVEDVEHVYSAGDITGGVKQWIVACGEGAVAAISAYNDLNL